MLDRRLGDPELLELMKKGDNHQDKVRILASREATKRQ